MKLPALQNAAVETVEILQEVVVCMLGEKLGEQWKPPWMMFLGMDHPVPRDRHKQFSTHEVILEEHHQFPCYYCYSLDSSSHKPSSTLC